MKNNPFISVIIPTYNSAEFIGNCLSCLGKQTSKDFEVIFVDDGSDDNTLEILNEFGFSNKSVIGIDHSGPAEARNVGVRHAKGEYIWFVDSDDVFVDNAIETIVDYLKQSEADLLRFRYRINGNNKLSSCKSPFKSGIYENNELFDIQRYAVGYGDAAPFFLWIHVYKKSIIENVPLLSLWDYLSESNSFNQRVYPRIKKLQVVDDVLYQYNIRPGSASFVHRPILDKTINLFKALKDDFNSLGIYEKYKDMVAFCVVDTLMLGFCVKGRGAFVTEYAFCSSIDVAHKRISDIMNTMEFDELINEVSKLETTTLIKKAHGIMLKKDEKILFEL